MNDLKKLKTDDAKEAPTNNQRHTRAKGRQGGSGGGGGSSGGRTTNTNKQNTGRPPPVRTKSAARRDKIDRRGDGETTGRRGAAIDTPTKQQTRHRQAATKQTTEYGGGPNPEPKDKHQWIEAQWPLSTRTIPGSV